MVKYKHISDNKKLLSNNVITELESAIINYNFDKISTLNDLLKQNKLSLNDVLVYNKKLRNKEMQYFLRESVKSFTNTSFPNNNIKNDKDTLEINNQNILLFYLIEYGLDPNISIFSQTPIEHAINYRNLDSVRYLLKSGAEVNKALDKLIKIFGKVKNLEMGNKDNVESLLFAQKAIISIFVCKSDLYSRKDLIVKILQSVPSKENIILQYIDFILLHNYNPTEYRNNSKTFAGSAQSKNSKQDTKYTEYSCSQNTNEIGRYASVPRCKFNISSDINCIKSSLILYFSILNIYIPKDILLKFICNDVYYPQSKAMILSLFYQLNYDVNAKYKGKNIYQHIICSKFLKQIASAIEKTPAENIYTDHLLEVIVRVMDNISPHNYRNDTKIGKDIDKFLTKMTQVYSHSTKSIRHYDLACLMDIERIASAYNLLSESNGNIDLTLMRTNPEIWKYYNKILLDDLSIELKNILCGEYDLKYSHAILERIFCIMSYYHISNDMNKDVTKDHDKILFTDNNREEIKLWLNNLVADSEIDWTTINKDNINCLFNVINRAFECKFISYDDINLKRICKKICDNAQDNNTELGFESNTETAITNPKHQILNNTELEFKSNTEAAILINQLYQDLGFKYIRQTQQTLNNTYDINSKSQTKLCDQEPNVDCYVNDDIFNKDNKNSAIASYGAKHILDYIVESKSTYIVQETQYVNSDANYYDMQVAEMRIISNVSTATSSVLDAASSSNIHCSATVRNTYDIE